MDEKKVFVPQSMRSEKSMKGYLYKNTRREFKNQSKQLSESLEAKQKKFVRFVVLKQCMQKNKNRSRL